MHKSYKYPLNPVIVNHYAKDIRDRTQKILDWGTVSSEKEAAAYAMAQFVNSDAHHLINYTKIDA